MKILYLDHEGGWGGASRSLWYLLSSLDRHRFSPLVWHRQDGPAVARLHSAGIPARLAPDLPNITPRGASHPGNWLVNVRRLSGIQSVARRIMATDADILHFNYEGLAPLALALDRAGDRRPRVLHVRVMNPVNVMTRLFVRHIAPLFQHIIFITENERERFLASGFDSAQPHSVLYNPVDGRLLTQEAQWPSSPPFRISFFGTLDALRGADRLIEVARILKARGVPARIDLFGRGPRYRKFLILKRRNEDNLRQAIAAAGVDGIVHLRGHSATPEAEMTASHAIIRASRGNDPWGRDVIEAMSLGRPVIASGRFEGFVRPGHTGYLAEPWQAEQVADLITMLARDPELTERLGRQACAVARELFDPERYAARIGGIYRDLLP